MQEFPIPYADWPRDSQPAPGSHGLAIARRAPDVYQDGRSPGSLVQARRCWLDLLSADTLALPQRFTFVFDCPTRRMAGGLVGFLRYADFAGFVRTIGQSITKTSNPHQVEGTTWASVWSLPRLEHLFMQLRAAGNRYESSLVSLDLHAAAGEHRTPTRTHAQGGA